MCRESKIPAKVCDAMVSLPDDPSAQSVHQSLALFSIPRVILTDARGRILDFRHELEFADGRDPWRAIEWILESDAPKPSPSPAPPSPEVKFNFPSMGTVWSVTDMRRWKERAGGSSPQTPGGRSPTLRHDFFGLERIERAPQARASGGSRAGVGAELAFFAWL